MTAVEVFNEITAIPKWYAGIFSPQSATNFKRSFKNSTHDFKTMEKIFNHHGYVFNCKSPWEKK